MSTAPLRLDYAAGPRRLHWVGIVLLVAAVAAAAQLLARFQELRQQLALVEVRRDLLDRSPGPLQRVSPQRLAEQSERAAAALRRLTVPWARMIETVEAASTPRVVLLQIQPEPERRTLRLTAQARTPEAMLDYVHRLGESRFLRQIYLISHQVQETAPGRPIQFVVQASFGEAT
jgi:Tfp pilus assembly protein PilN